MRMKTTFLFLDVQCYFCVGQIGTECDDDTFDPSIMPVQDCSAAGYEERCSVSFEHMCEYNYWLHKLICFFSFDFIIVQI